MSTAMIPGETAMPNETTLSCLERPSGWLGSGAAQWVGKIVRMDLPESAATRLKAMGLFEGQNVAIARWGSPMIVKAAGAKIAVGDEIAGCIVVQRDAT